MGGGAGGRTRAWLAVSGPRALAFLLVTRGPGVRAQEEHGDCRDDACEHARGDGAPREVVDHLLVAALVGVADEVDTADVGAGHHEQDSEGRGGRTFPRRMGKRLGDEATWSIGANRVARGW